MSYVLFFQSTHSKENGTAITTIKRIKKRNVSTNGTKAMTLSLDDFRATTAVQSPKPCYIRKNRCCGCRI